MPSARSRGTLGARPGPPTLEDVAEPVACRDLGDLAEPAEVPLFRARCHAAVLHAHNSNIAAAVRTLSPWTQSRRAANPASEGCFTRRGSSLQSASASRWS